MATAGAPHGDFALKVSAPTGSTMAFVSDCPDGILCSVASTTAGATYVASAYVRALSGPWNGSPFARPVTIVLSEYAQNGVLLNETVGETVTPTSSFRHLAVAARPKAAQHVIGVRVQQNFPAANDGFLADLITLTEAQTVMRVFGGPLGAPVAWTPVGVNTKRVSKAPLITSEPADVARLSVVLDGAGAPGVTGYPLAIISARCSSPSRARRAVRCPPGRPMGCCTTGTPRTASGPPSWSAGRASAERPGHQPTARPTVRPWPSSRCPAITCTWRATCRAARWRDRPCNGASEDELLDLAQARGWNIDRELGLHFCPLTTVHDCDVCGAPTRMAIGEAGTSLTYNCAEHWPL